jgi:hypothetical protein
MTRPLLLFFLAGSLLAGCSGEPAEPDRVVLVAPTPDGVREARRCDDGGEGGVLIDGICL